MDRAVTQWQSTQRLKNEGHSEKRESSDTEFPGFQEHMLLPQLSRPGLVISVIPYVNSYIFYECIIIPIFKSLEVSNWGINIFSYWAQDKNGFSLPHLQITWSLDLC